MSIEGFRCKQCGRCCHLPGAFDKTVKEEDIKAWKANGRFDILRWVDCINFPDHKEYDVWISPVTGEDVKRCPWLRKLPNKDKYKCKIHEDKPGYCKNFPLSIEQLKIVGCLGLE